MKTEPYQNPQQGDLQVYSTAAWHLVRIFLSNLPDFYKVNNNELDSNKDIEITELSAICQQQFHSSHGGYSLDFRCG